jgi:hypothetical protein
METLFELAAATANARALKPRTALHTLISHFAGRIIEMPNMNKCARPSGGYLMAEVDLLICFVELISPKSSHFASNTSLIRL